MDCWLVPLKAFQDLLSDSNSLHTVTLDGVDVLADHEGAGFTPVSSRGAIKGKSSAGAGLQVRRNTSSAASSLGSSLGITSDVCQYSVLELLAVRASHLVLGLSDAARDLLVADVPEELLA